MSENEKDLDLLEDETEEECFEEEEEEYTPTSPAEEKIEELTKELRKLKDMHLRTAAEYDNFRKRTQKEKEALFAAVQADTVAELLPIVDNLERAMAVENITLEDLQKGVSMIMSESAKVFERLSVESFGEVGEQFDPNIHNCIGTSDDSDVESGCISMVAQKGYRIGQKTIRPAMVQIKN
ncbi:MAG: nucleotide exchange factor GrpE [Oscillospiraceae bacterium]|jgi:molecular chaperone GrpE|nr:nucleotide exchange factor GrpE [Oscillospiraceae bacterium]